MLPRSLAHDGWFDATHTTGAVAAGDGDGDTASYQHVVTSAAFLSLPHWTSCSPLCCARSACTPRSFLCVHTAHLCALMAYE